MTAGNEQAPSELELRRHEILGIDEAIIGLLARRLALAARIGVLKREAGLQILDPTREAAVIRRASELAGDAGLPVEPVREIFWQIVGMSRHAQEHA